VTVVVVAERKVITALRIDQKRAMMHLCLSPRMNNAS